MKIYANALLSELPKAGTGYDYFKKYINNYVDFAIENPGLLRFVASDPLPGESVPDHLLKMVAKMKQHFIDRIYLLSQERLSKPETRNVSDIILSYMDGETLNLINDRFLPEEDINARVFRNVEKLFTLLTSKVSDGIDLIQDVRKAENIDFPIKNI